MLDLEDSVQARIDKIAAGQRARMSRTQLLAAGVSSSAIGRRLNSGRLVRVHAGVYGLPHTSAVPLAAETAALLACYENAALSHHSAATLWGLRPGVARPIHVTLYARSSGPTPVGVALHRSETITEPDVRIHDGLPVTSPARTLLDVAASLPDRDVERMFDEGLFTRRVLTRREIVDVLARAGHHPGRGRLARVARAHSRPTRTDSRPEEALLRMVRAAGLPEPRLQATVLDYRVDLYWPDLRLAVEVDAYTTHGSSARFEADRRRDARLLTELGIVVIRVTKLAIETRPFEVIALLARAIGRREAERAGSS